MKPQTLHSSARFKNLLGILFLWLALIPHPGHAQSEAVLTDKALHVALIETALRYDFYNARCRGISISKNLDRVNRLFVTKYGLTANNFIRTHISVDTQAVQEKIENQLNHELNQMGGCTVAKEKGLVQEIRKQYNALYEQAEKSAWFPEE